MRIPVIQGQIERRLLVNYRVDPDALGRLLPAPFRPQLVDGAGVAGICLIRLGSLRPRSIPAWAGLSSENAAHRIAVERDGPAGRETGVFIPRRETDSWVNVAVGGRLFPGRHHRARFEVAESEDEIRVAYAAHDGSAQVDVSIRTTDQFRGSRLFADLAEASAFFAAGSVGYSATSQPQRFDGLGLKTHAWKVEATAVNHVHSSFFEDQSVFPGDAAQFDNALLRRSVPVLWEPLPSLRSDSAAV